MVKIKIIKNNFKNPLVILLIFLIVGVWVFSGWPEILEKSLLTFETKPVRASPGTIENLWSGSNSVSTVELTLTSSADADGSGTGTWADADGQWAKATVEWWEFVMGDSGVGSGTLNSVTLYLKHYQSGWADDNFLIEIYNGSTWIEVQSYIEGSGPPGDDTTNNWDVKALGIDSWTKINAAKVRIIGNGVTKGEDSVDWFVDTVELRIDYTAANNPPVVEAVSLTPDPITLTENTTTTVTCTSTISDEQQGSTIISATATIYRSGVTSTFACSANDNNCYQNITPLATSSAGNYFYATFTKDIWFHAEPTDEGAYATAEGWNGQTWDCYVIAEDNQGATGTSSDSVELNTLSALIITSSINYGTLGPGATSSASFITTATTTGNIPIDVKLKGQDLVSNGYSFEGDQQEYALSQVDYGSGTDLATTTYADLELESLKPVQHNPIQATATDIIYWRIEIPADQEFGTYYGTTSAAATPDT